MPQKQKKIDQNPRIKIDNKRFTEDTDTGII